MNPFDLARSFSQLTIYSFFYGVDTKVYGIFGAGVDVRIRPKRNGLRCNYTGDEGGPTLVLSNDF